MLLIFARTKLRFDRQIWLLMYAFICLEYCFIFKDAVTIKKNGDSKETKPLKNIQYEWGSLNVVDFVQKLAQEGITDAKVEQSANGVIIHLVINSFGNICFCSFFRY